MYHIHRIRKLQNAVFRDHHQYYTETPEIIIKKKQQELKSSHIFFKHGTKYKIKRIYKQPHEVELGRAGSVQRKAAQTRKWTEINKDLAYEFKNHGKKFEK